MLNLCFTADHELFFGENFFTEREVLIEPTYNLMEVLRKYSVPLIIMTDVCSIWKYRELGVEGNYADDMEEQLKKAVLSGHDVQLHIHPEWINAKRINEKWIFDKSKFRLHNYKFKNSIMDSEKTWLYADDIILRGKKYLDDLLGCCNSSYRCVAYRAGGWAIQPERELFKTLLEKGILIDTTVFKGGYREGHMQFFDFRNVLSELSWWINPEKGIEFPSNKKKGNIFEVSIGNYYKVPFVWLKKLRFKITRKIRKSGKKTIKGLSLDEIFSMSDTKKYKKIKHFFSSPMLLSFDNASSDSMIDIVKYYLKNYDCINNEYYVSIIGHPKILTEDDLKEISVFCKVINEKYKEKVRFRRFIDIAKEIQF